MKLLRYGPKGREKPGLLDKNGVIRDLSGVIPDITPATLAAGAVAKAKKAKPEIAAGGDEGRAHRLLRRRRRQFHRHRPQLRRPRQGDRRADPDRADHLQQGAVAASPGRTTTSSSRKGSKKTDWEVELAVIIGKGGSYIDEKDALSHVAGYAVCHDVSEREFQTRARRPVDQGQGLPDLRPARAVAGHPRRGQGRPGPRHVPRRQRQAHADRHHQDDDLRRRASRQLCQPVHAARSRAT